MAHIFPVGGNKRDWAPDLEKALKKEAMGAYCDDDIAELDVLEPEVDEKFDAIKGLPGLGDDLGDELGAPEGEQDIAEKATELVEKVQDIAETAQEIAEEVGGDVAEIGEDEVGEEEIEIEVDVVDGDELDEVIEKEGLDSEGCGSGSIAGEEGEVKEASDKKGCCDKCDCDPCECEDKEADASEEIVEADATVEVKVPEVEKAEETIEAVASSASPFVKLSALTPQNRKDLVDYWQNMLGFPSEYVKAMTNDYEK